MLETLKAKMKTMPLKLLGALKHPLFLAGIATGYMGHPVLKPMLSMVWGLVKLGLKG